MYISPVFSDDKATLERTRKRQGIRPCAFPCLLILAWIVLPGSLRQEMADVVVAFVVAVAVDSDDDDGDDATMLRKELVEEVEVVSLQL